MRSSTTQGRSAARAALAALVLALGLVALAPTGPTADAVLSQCGIIAGHHCAYLTVTLSGNGTGLLQTTDSTWTTPNNLVNCQRGGGTTSGTCAHGYDVSSTQPTVTVFFVLSPAADSKVCLTGICSANPGKETITFATDTPVDAFSFVLIDPVTVSTVKSGTGSGSITSSPRGISCGATCSDAFGAGLPIVLAARPATGSVFGAWGSGPCLGQGSTCTFTPSVDVAFGVDFLSTANAATNPYTGADAFPPPDREP